MIWVPLTALQAVNVLGVQAQQQALLMQHADEVVHVVGPVVARVQLLGQGEEWTRVIGEIVDIEDGLWVREVVLFQVGIQTSPWCPARTRETDTE